MHCSSKYLLMGNVSLHVCAARVWQVRSGELHQGVWPSVWHRWKHLRDRMRPLPEKQVCNTHASTLARTCTRRCAENYDITHQSTRKESTGYRECSGSSEKSRTELKSSASMLVWIFSLSANFTELVNPCRCLPTLCCYHVCKSKHMNWFVLW